MVLHVVRRSQWKEWSTGGNSVISWEVTDSVVSESKYEVRSLWRNRSIAWESSKAEVAILSRWRGGAGGLGRNRKGPAGECIYNHKRLKAYDGEEDVVRREGYGWG